MRLICLAIPLLALAGCSSIQADSENVKPVPADRLLAFQEPLQGGGEIVVNRDIGMLGGGCYLAFSIDRQVAARIGIGEEAHFKVPAGARIVGIGIDTKDDTLCGKGRLHRELAVQLDSGASQHFRIVSEAKTGFGIVAETH
ncbi:3-isopropylmalate dehydratase [Pseudomonas sp. NA-150]|uniref:3-isopropylmalate dehydratase n=1 Tax=Pseudomonas sp. NA-150 TaxID=3367525 RepID=UPI0037C748EF